MRRRVTLDDLPPEHPNCRVVSVALNPAIADAIDKVRALDDPIDRLVRSAVVDELRVREDQAFIFGTSRTAALVAPLSPRSVVQVTGLAY